MSVKFKQSTQVATAIATVVYSNKVTTNVDQFQQIWTILVERLLRYPQLDNCNHV